MQESRREWKNQSEENLEGNHYYLSSGKIHGWETTSFQLSPHLWSFSYIIVPCVDSADISFSYFLSITCVTKWRMIDWCRIGGGLRLPHLKK